MRTTLLALFLTAAALPALGAPSAPAAAPAPDPKALQAEVNQLRAETARLSSLVNVEKQQRDYLADQVAQLAAVALQRPADTASSDGARGVRSYPP